MVTFRSGESAPIPSGQFAMERFASRYTFPPEAQPLCGDEDRHDVSPTTTSASSGGWPGGNPTKLTRMNVAAEASGRPLRLRAAHALGLVDDRRPHSSVRRDIDRVAIFRRALRNPLESAPLRARRGGIRRSAQATAHGRQIVPQAEIEKDLATDGVSQTTGILTGWSIDLRGRDKRLRL